MFQAFGLRDVTAMLDGLNNLALGIPHGIAVHLEVPLPLIGQGNDHVPPAGLPRLKDFPNMAFLAYRGALVKDVVAISANNVLGRELIEIHYGLIRQVDAIIAIINDQRVGDAVKDSKEKSGVLLGHGCSLCNRGKLD